MKKLNILSLIALSAAMAACSSDDVATADGMMVEDNSPVLINLTSGAKQTLTRASVESYGAKNAFNAEGMGLYMLASDKTGLNVNALDIDWLDNNYTFWWDNVNGTATAVTDPDGGDDYTKITADVEGYKAYYPTGDWYKYSFYAYYPRQEENNMSSDSRSVYINIDGTQDIIWGKASSDDQFGYCARYFRQTAHMTEVPNISMSHKMTRIRFATIAGADGTGNYDGALRMGIRTIKVLQVPTRGYLTVANLTDPTQEGVLTFDWSEDADKADLAIKDSTDAEFTGFADHRVAMQEKYVGQPILLPVPAADYVYKVYIELEDEDGTVFPTETPLELNFASQGINFEAGKSYKVVMTIHGPKIIEAKASLTPWEESSDEINLELN